jgi:hypothetical protein
VPKEARSLPELLAAAVGGVVLGAGLVAAVDAAFSMTGLGTFGDLSGMFAAFPAVFILYEEYRIRRRTALALLCAVLALVVGTGVGYLVSGAAPPLVSGAVAALAAVVVYVLLWHTATTRWEQA